MTFKTSLSSHIDIIDPIDADIIGVKVLDKLDDGLIVKPQKDFGDIFVCQQVSKSCIQK